MTYTEPISFVSAFVGAAISFISAYFIHRQKFTKPYLTMFVLLQGLSFLVHGIYGMFFEHLKIIGTLPLTAASYYLFFFLAITFLVKFVSFPLEDFVSITQIKLFGVKMPKLTPSSLIVTFAVLMASLAFLPGAILEQVHLMGSWYTIGTIGFLAGYFQSFFWIFWFYWHYKETVLNNPVSVADKEEIAVFINGVLSLPVVMVLHPYAELLIPDWVIHTAIVAITIVTFGAAVLFEARRTSLYQFFSGLSKKEQVDLLKTAFQQSFEGMVIADMTGRIVFVNSRWAEIQGYEKNELIGKDLNFVCNAEQMKKIDDTERSILTKGSWIGKIDHLRKDGAIFPTLTSKSLLRDSRGEPVATLTTSRDITEQKRMQKELKKYSQQLEKEVEKRTRQLKEAQECLLKSERLAAIGEVAAMVGHDLRNPLQSIENATYYLNTEFSRLSSYDPISQKTMEMLGVINDSVNYADRIIRDLQDFSATKKPTLMKTDINAIVMEALSQVKASENVEIVTELSRLPEIKVDKSMMKRVFLNLAVNGIQAMEKGGRLKVSAKKTKGYVEVSFEDTGAGIPKENMEKIFIPFFTTKAKGMGMGLPVCKRLVDAHGGSIEVESEEGKGTTFTVKLPIPQDNGGDNQ